MVGRGVVDRGVVGRGVEGSNAANHDVVGCGEPQFPPSPISGNSTLWNFGVEGSSPKPALDLFDLNMIVRVAGVLIRGERRGRARRGDGRAVRLYGY